MYDSKDQKKSVMNVKRRKIRTIREKCKNRAGLEGKPGLRAWSKCRAPALTRPGPQVLTHGQTDPLIEMRGRIEK